MPSVLNKANQNYKSDIDLTEIINGEERMSPSPFSIHQKFLMNLFYEIRKFISEKNPGEIMAAPLDVIFEENINRLQPDLIYIKNDNLSIIQDWIRGVPDMVAEIVSKGSFEKDTIEKKAIYEKYGVKEFWLVFPDYETVEVFVLENGKYILHSSFEENGSAKSKIIEGFEIESKILFKK